MPALLLAAVEHRCSLNLKVDGQSAKKKSEVQKAGMRTIQLSSTLRGRLDIDLGKRCFRADGAYVAEAIIIHDRRIFNVLLVLSSAGKRVTVLISGEWPGSRMLSGRESDGRLIDMVTNMHDTCTKCR